jgi:exonuclease III
MVADALAGGLTACGIDRDLRKGTKPSDHAPLLADLAGA